MAAKPAAVDPQEFNRLVQKIDLVEEDSIEAGFKGMKFKGVLDVGYSNDEISAATGFDKARGIAYRADYTVSEYRGIGFSGVHMRTKDGPGDTDLIEIDAFHIRGDLTLQGQLSPAPMLGGGAFRPCSATS